MGVTNNQPAKKANSKVCLECNEPLTYCNSENPFWGCLDCGLQWEIAELKSLLGEA